MNLVINKSGKEILNEENLDDDQIQGFLEVHKENVLLSITMHPRENMTVEEMETAVEDCMVKMVVELK